MAIIYSIKYTDQTSDPVNKKPFTIAPGAMDNTTSLTLPGQAAALYGESIAENFLHMLENFSSATPPENPTVGQLWYDSVLKQIRVLTAINVDGAGVKSYTWSPISGPYISTTPPPNSGTLWFDTSDADPALWQLKIYNAGQAGWVSVAEQYIRKSGDVITGSIVSETESVGFTSGAGLNGLYPAAVSGPTLAGSGNATILFNTSGAGNAAFNISNAATFAGSIDDAALLLQVTSAGTVHIRKGQLNMNANKIVGVAAGTALTDGVNFGQLSTINTDLSGLISALETNKVNRSGDTMSGALTITTAGTGTGTGGAAGEGTFALIVNGTSPDSGGILIRAQDDNNDESAIEVVNNYGQGGATQQVFGVKAFTGDTTVAGTMLVKKAVTLQSSLSVAGTAAVTGMVTMDQPMTSIINARHLTTKEYVDTKINALISTDVFARVNPSSPRVGDILINGSIISIYVSTGWKQVFPAQWAD